MARVTFVSSFCDNLTGGAESLELSAANVFGLVRALEARFPGMAEHVEKRAAIAVDGEVVQAWGTPISEDSEVLLYPRIAGG